MTENHPFRRECRSCRAGLGAGSGDTVAPCSEALCMSFRQSILPAQTSVPHGL
jgi:hypothetical protein